MLHFLNLYLYLLSPFNAWIEWTIHTAQHLPLKVLEGKVDISIVDTVKDVPRFSSHCPHPPIPKLDFDVYVIKYIYAYDYLHIENLVHNFDNNMRLSE